MSCREPAPEAVQLSRQVDAVVGHTEELLRAVRGEVQAMATDLDAARTVLEQELARPAPVAAAGAHPVHALPVPCKKSCTCARWGRRSGWAAAQQPRHVGGRLLPQS